VKRYASADRDELAAGRDLKVDAIVYGTVERLGEQLQVEARLARVATGNELWSDTHRLRAAETLEFQDHLAADIVRAIRVEITPQDRVRMARKETTNLEAWNAFHTGMYHWFREDQGSISNALHYFALATRADTNFAAAWAGMAAVHTLSAGVGMPFTNTWTAWKAPAERALFLDPDLALANAHYGMGLLILERDPEQAERYLRRALELDPLDPLGWNCYGNLLYARNEPEAAIRHGRKATELEPTVPFWWLDVAWFLNGAGRHEEALSEADKGLELMKFQSGLGRNQKGWSYLLLKRYREALEEFGAAVALEAENPGFRFGLGCALAQAGQRDAAQRTLAELQALRAGRPVSRVYTAGVLLALGEREAALAELERGTAEPDAALWWLGGDPWFAQLRDEPRFQAVLKAGRKPLN